MMMMMIRMMEMVVTSGAVRHAELQSAGVLEDSRIYLVAVCIIVELLTSFVC